MLTRLLLRAQAVNFLIAAVIVIAGGHLLTAALFGGASIAFWLAAWGVWFLYE